MPVPAARLRVDVLGPVRAWDASGSELTPQGGLQRKLLALLVLHRGRVVPVDTAVEALWPSELPRDPVAALQNHVSRLRSRLPEGVVESVGAGYRLDPALVEVDADRVAALVAGGADGTDDAGAGTADVDAARVVEAVLARWHGPAFPELADLDEGRAEAVRLDELRLRAREEQAARRVQRGAPDGVAVELASLVDEQPLRERPRALLMAALAAEGRTAEALRVYDDFRRLLGAELGIEPSPTLARQHTALLGGAGTAASRVVSSHLPVPLTALVGRQALLADVVADVATSRLVTLVGPGGVGKTRLLIEVGHRLQAGRPDERVVLCELAKADEASAVEVVASSFGIDARAGVPPMMRTVDVVGATELVLLLDNCEHVLAPVAELVEQMLSRCPGVRVVATSRERLRVPGEKVRVVPTLLSEGGEPVAVELFVQRARSVRPDFVLDDAGRQWVAEIVRRLDGLPLGIELAGARLHTHELAEVAEALGRRFSLLSGGPRSSARHASLAAVVSWSFALLDRQLQEAFAALSVFSGPFTATDAAAVCGLGDEDAAAAMVQLVERSLVMRAPRQQFVVLETIRAFGAEELSVSGRAEAVGERHARRLLRWAEEAEGRLHRSGEPVLAEVDDRIGELRAGLAWLLEHDGLEDAGRLVTALVNYALLRLRPDVLSWSEGVLAADPDDRSPLAPRLWAARAYAVWMAGDVTTAGALAARAVGVAERQGVMVPAVAATMRGNYDLFEGRLGEAAVWYHRAVDAAGGQVSERLVSAGALLLALGYARDPRAAALADELLHEVGPAESGLSAYVWYCAGEAALPIDLDLARGRLRRAVELGERTNASFVKGVAGASKASIEARAGDPADAIADYRWLIPHWQRAGMWSTQWTMLRSIAALLERLGRHREAAVLEGAVRATASGHRIFGADEVALAELRARLRGALGDEAYGGAVRQGAVLDGHAAAEHALAALSLG